MDETKIDVTFVILKVRNPQVQSVDRAVPVSQIISLSLGPRTGRAGAWIPAKRDNEYDVAFSQ